MNIELLVIQTKQKFREYIDMLYIQAKSKLDVKDVKDIDKNISEELIENFLKKRGYTMNYILGKRVMIKDFTCVFVANSHIEIWHDIPNSKSVYITQSYLTNLPITLNYMENI